ncbi:MAG: type II/IV secretion system protein [Gemmatimonadetes bacterium]|jgi:type IV pilus assembly protein PilB|nr:type II/IV secretion system protein [Gemmatimonadota bacterium]MBT6144387.1 type II/IV secretion system protein [Gemmatimonadota bacterium]MBT7859388.1 type II/IV secretion system protein [Gemmatimonadota bacterium]
MTSPAALATPRISCLVGRALVEQGLVDDFTLSRALEAQKKEPDSVRRRIGDILIEDFGVDRHLVYCEVARIYGVEEHDLEGFEPDEASLDFLRSLFTGIDPSVREQLMERGVLPFELCRQGRSILIVLAADPMDKSITGLVAHCGYPKFEVRYGRREEIDRLYATILPPTNEFLEILEEMSHEVDTELALPGSIDEEGLDAEIHQSRLTQLVEATLVEAVLQGASDIHIVPQAGNVVEFKFRVDGQLQVWHVQENTRPEAISAVFKDRARNVDRFERDAAQDGYMQRHVDGRVIRFRVSILPMVGMETTRKLESIVIRVLDDEQSIHGLGDLGLPPRAREDFLEGVSSPQGLVILTGPTGSGKSTTLKAALGTVNKPGLCVLTIEDPVEYLIPNARQLKINPKMDFEQALRSILRHDPDIVMLGEVRDATTADIAIKLANTGHLTFSTLHTNDAPSAVSRLYKMGVEPFLLANAINLIMAQRLIRTLCEQCKRETTEDIEVPRALGFTDEEVASTTFYEPVGCDACNNGWKGRVAIFEMLLMTREIRRMVLRAEKNIDEETIRQHAVDQGMLTLRMAGREQIGRGVTTCDEVAFATAED